MLRLNKWQKDHENAILTQFSTSESELTLLELHRRTRIPTGVLSSVLERMIHAGRLSSRMGEKTEYGTYHSRYRLNSLPGPC